MKLDFLTSIDLEDVRKIGKRAAVIDGFAMERSINLIWAMAGMGKTSFIFDLASVYVQEGWSVAYIDTDNGIDLLQDRGYDKQIEAMGGKIKYINADYLVSPKQEITEMLEKIKAEAKKGAYEKCVFFFDSLKFFLNGLQYDEGRIDKFIEVSKTIRRAGGTVWILNHAYKNGLDMKGGGSLTDAVDEQWELKGLGKANGVKRFLLTPKKYRMNVLECAFESTEEIVDNHYTGNIVMRHIDLKVAKISPDDMELVEKFKAKIAEHTDGIKQTALLASLELTKSDRTGLRILEEHTGFFWEVEAGARNAKIYKCRN